VDVTGNIPAKLCEVGSEFNIFCTLVTMATVTILNLFTPAPQQLPHIEVVLLRVDFFKMAAVAMETAKILKN
jgi:hypothetical protein